MDGNRYDRGCSEAAEHCVCVEIAEFKYFEKKFREINYIINKFYCRLISRNIFKVRMKLLFLPHCADAVSS